VSKPPPAASRSSAGSPRARVVWYGLMAISGFGFGLLAERRPFGEGILFHPLVVFFALAGLGLLALRMALARPVPVVYPPPIKYSDGQAMASGEVIPGDF